jgi:hypothetical protein
MSGGIAIEGSRNRESYPKRSCLDFKHGVMGKGTIGVEGTVDLSDRVLFIRV